MKRQTRETNVNQISIGDLGDIMRNIIYSRMLDPMLSCKNFVFDFHKSEV